MSTVYMFAYCKFHITISSELFSLCAMRRAPRRPRFSTLRSVTLKSFRKLRNVTQSFEVIVRYYPFPGSSLPVLCSWESKIVLHCVLPLRGFAKTLCKNWCQEASTNHEKTGLEGLRPWGPPHLINPYWWPPVPVLDRPIWIGTPFWALIDNSKTS